jgi:hypothetical protein
MDEVIESGQSKRRVLSIDRYEEFKNKVKDVLEKSGAPLTWEDIRVRAGFTQRFPNNVWVKSMEKDIGLIRKNIKGKVYWSLKK